jgi:hypothetical protein
MRTCIGGPFSAPKRNLGSLAVTAAACGCLLFLPGTAHALSPTGNEIAQPVRKHHPRQPAKAAEAVSPKETEPRAEPEAKKPSAPESYPSGQDSQPDEDEEVTPGDNPASCDGCELAGVLLGGSLWGLFGVPRRRGVPRPGIRGLQLR